MCERGLLFGLLPLREAAEFVKGEGLLSGEFPLREAAEYITGREGGGCFQGSSLCMRLQNMCERGASFRAAPTA